MGMNPKVDDLSFTVLMAVSILYYGKACACAIRYWRLIERVMCYCAC